MVKGETILTGLLVGGAVVLLGGVLRGEETPSGMLENLEIAIEGSQQKQAEKQQIGPEKDKRDRQQQRAAAERERQRDRGQVGPTAGQFGIAGSQEATVPVKTGGRKTATAASPGELATDDPAAVALSAVRGSGFQGDFI